MSQVFGIPIKNINNCFRQGDLMFCPVKIPTTRREWCDNCGKTKQDHIEQTEIYCVNCGDEKKRCVCDHPDFHERVELYCYENIGWEIYSPHVEDPVKMVPQEKWEVRESHEIWSPGLERNGRYIRSNCDIAVSHSSHEMIILPAGEYRLHVSRVEDAD